MTHDFAGLTVCKTGPWGQGPVFLQQLALLDRLGVAGLAPGSAELIHAVIECAKLAFADREAWYGDPGSPRCRWPTCSRTTTPRNGRRWSARTPPRTCGRAVPAGRAPAAWLRHR